MVIRNNKKGQAAIEFLMTYGWMLLVVLIVGALIFSFVDFGSLLPNRVDLSGSIAGDPTASIAYADNTGAGAPAEGSLAEFQAEENDVKIVFKYTGPKRVQINGSDGLLTTELGDKCLSVGILNLDTKESQNLQGDQVTAGTLDNPYSNIQGNAVSFLNGQTGIMNFTCSDLFAGDVVQGELSIKVLDPKTKFTIASKGSVRLAIQE